MYRGWFPWLIQLVWIVPVTLLAGGTCVAQAQAPSAYLEPDHCYRVEHRHGWTIIAGYRNVEIACP